MASSAVHHFSSPAEAIMPGIQPAASGTAAAAGHSKPSGSSAGKSVPVHHFSSHSEASPSPQPEAASNEPDAASVSVLQARVAAALAQGCSVSAAARAAGVHRTTVHHWQRTSPQFCAAVEQARREFTESLADDMLDLAHSAHFRTCSQTPALPPPSASKPRLRFSNGLSFPGAAGTCPPASKPHRNRSWWTPWPNSKRITRSSA